MSLPSLSWFHVRPRKKQVQKISGESAYIPNWRASPTVAGPERECDGVVPLPASRLSYKGMLGIQLGEKMKIRQNVFSEKVGRVVGVGEWWGVLPLISSVAKGASSKTLQDLGR